jgi:hypothetical protein
MDGKPTSYTPTAHDHLISEVTGLQTALNGKLNLSGGTMTGPITMGSNNITGNNSSIFQAGRIIATNSNTSAHGITSKGTRANMLYLMDGVTGGLAASLLDVDVKNTTTPQKRIAKIGILGGAASSTDGTPYANYLWLSAVDGNTYNKDATLKVDAQNRVGIAIAGSGRPTQALDVDGKIRMRTATVDSDGSDIVVTKGYMLSKIASSDTNNYLTNVSGSGNGTVTFTRENLLPLTWDATHSHTWSSITGKPTTFTPSSHGHAWGEITGKPTTFNPSSHNHSISDITNLQSTLDKKIEPQSSLTASNNCNNITTTGIYVGNWLSNRPTGASSYGTLITTQTTHESSSHLRQIYLSESSTKMYTRVKASTWGAWEQIGTMSLSGTTLNITL